MKYLVVIYQDSYVMGQRKFNTREEAEKSAQELRDLDFWESIKIYEISDDE